ncbi:MAG: thioredoxin-dependent thiol peroxidase [Candidatus Hydrogenedentes bacterium]|nr:thioredoxin-dependent thiol peroxidase [Candidatus Hydrogenedentota bacterium]
MATKKEYQVKEGESAPNFKLKDHKGNSIELNKLKGKYVVLYFYPKDDTPGCTIEAKGFQSLIRDFEKKNTIVLGVSPDSGESHCAFAEKYGLTFHLLTDENHKVAETYGAWGEKNMYGKKSFGIIRSTFLISPEGIIIKAWRKVNPDGHAEEVLASIPEKN